jgi:predicted ATPase
MQLDSLTIRGYKSIRELEGFPLHNLNILIGANGAGKSNFISLFRMLASFPHAEFQAFVRKEGGPDALLFKGRKATSAIGIEFYGSGTRYEVVLEPTADNRLIFHIEDAYSPQFGFFGESILGGVHDESKLAKPASQVWFAVSTAVKSWRVYHFHDTGDSAIVKQQHKSNDNLRLKPDAGNLAAYVARLKREYPAAYQRIVDTIRQAAPFFGDFVVRDPVPQTIELEWTEYGDPDTPYQAHVLSDGTLRFICLTTLLLQPDSLLPDTILIDEPELGLHPFAINLLSEMLKQVAATKQVIVSTQSVELINNFEPEDIIVVDRQDGASTFKRLKTGELTDWLEDYTMGELWKRNILGGRPTYAGVKG